MKRSKTQILNSCHPLTTRETETKILKRQRGLEKIVKSDLGINDENRILRSNKEQRKYLDP